MTRSILVKHQSASFLLQLGNRHSQLITLVPVKKSKKQHAKADVHLKSIIYLTGSATRRI